MATHRRGQYYGWMRISNEVLASSLHEDMVQLVKAYARLGFKQVHNGEQGFEELWRDVFQLGESQVRPLVSRTLALVPTHRLPE